MKFGRSGKGGSPKKLESVIEDPYVFRVNVYVPGFNVILISSPFRVPRPSYPFRRNFGRSGKGSFTKKLKSLIEVPYVVVPYVTRLKVQFLRFNMNLISSL